MPLCRKDTNKECCEKSVERDASSFGTLPSWRQFEWFVASLESSVAALVRAVERRTGLFHGRSLSLCLAHLRVHGSLSLCADGGDPLLLSGGAGFGAEAAGEAAQRELAAGDRGRVGRHVVGLEVVCLVESKRKSVNGLD